MSYRPIPGAPGYDVNKSGIVRSYHRRGRGKIIGTRANKLKKIFRKNTGYYYVHLRMNGKRTKVPIHICVLTSFVGPRPTGYQACHNNGVQTDNRLSNLRWGTPKDNQQDSIKHGTKANQRRKVRYFSDKDVRLIHVLRQSGLTGMTIAKLFHVAYQTIYRILSGQRYAEFMERRQ